jgi:RNA polymerase sigma factor (sigma-70 family)
VTTRNDTGSEDWVTEVVRRERPRLKSWLRRHAPSSEDVDDILQETFCELFVAYRLTVPIQHAGAWLMQVARNRLTDLFRRNRTVSLESMNLTAASNSGEGEQAGAHLVLDDLLPNPEPGPEATYAWNALVLELEAALEALPEAQRKVFIAHEIHGQSFNEIAAATGDSLGTLLSRKHSAVLSLRKRLRPTYNDTVGI